MKNEQISEQYEDAMRRLKPHIKRLPDGTFDLDVTNGQDAGIDDPIVFADLARSLEHTNELIRRGDILPEDIDDDD